jgi:hypothetical protein
MSLWLGREMAVSGKSRTAWPSTTMVEIEDSQM